MNALSTDTNQVISKTKSHSAKHRHLLDVDSLSSDDVAYFLDNAEFMRSMITSGSSKMDSLRGKSIYTLFFENSTRTRVSFEQAGKTLGADVINIAASDSSVKKGESLLNTVLTINAMQMDGLILRHPDAGAPNFVAKHIDTPLINAGDGLHAHPTQALLDAMTLRRTLGNLNDAKIAIIGDILHSRVARSDIILLARMGAHISVAGPPTLMPYGWIPGAHEKVSTDNGGNDVEVRICQSVEQAIDDADVIITLRLQIERQSEGLLPDVNEYSRVWGIDAKKLSLASTNAVVMHPGPMNEGIEISTDVAHGPRSLIKDQVLNGVAIRMAVLQAYCGNEGLAH